MKRVFRFIPAIEAGGTLRRTKDYLTACSKPASEACVTSAGSCEHYVGCRSGFVQCASKAPRSWGPK